jgi:hypothetical protein
MPRDRCLEPVAIPLLKTDRVAGLLLHLYGGSDLWGYRITTRSGADLADASGDTATGCRRKGVEHARRIRAAMDWRPDPD